MNTIQTIHLIYFSPTHTSLRVIESIAKGFENVHIVKHDLTCKALSDIAFDVADLAIIGIPVYAGRLPKLAVERMESLKGNNTPAVSVVVYGNSRRTRLPLCSKSRQGNRHQITNQRHQHPFTKGKPSVQRKTTIYTGCPCVKFCPQEARTFFQPRAEWLFNNYSVRKEPELYL